MVESNKMFKLLKKSSLSRARIATLSTGRADILTPFFMPVATRGVVKNISSNDLARLGYKIILSNTYHLLLRPGNDFIKKVGGLHKFIDWPGAILTDSGGFQIFSLSRDKNKSGKSLIQLKKSGVEFKSYLDGKSYYLTPEKIVQIQVDLGVDIAVCLDECVSLPAEKSYLEKSIELTSRWAKRSKIYHNKLKGNKPLLFCVIQGGLFPDLRLKSLASLSKMNFDGYNIGGLSVGETESEMYQIIENLSPHLPQDKPHYLMGVGYPENIIEAVKYGIDMFDCVIPTREGRHGKLFAWQNYRCGEKILDSKKIYQTCDITLAKYSFDHSPINKHSSFPELVKHSKSYLNYLFKINEPLASRLATINNLEFYHQLMVNLQILIKNNKI